MTGIGYGRTPSSRKPGRSITRHEETPRSPERWPTPQALEKLIELAWLELPRMGQTGAPATVYLAPSGLHVGGPLFQGGRGAIVGRYDQRVHLVDFREDVFAEYEKQTGRG